MKKLFVQSVCIGIALSFFVGVVSVGAQAGGEINPNRTTGSSMTSGAASNPQSATNAPTSPTSDTSNATFVGTVGDVATFIPRTGLGLLGIDVPRPSDVVNNVEKTLGIVSDPISGLRHGILIALWGWAKFLAGVTSVVGSIFDTVIKILAPTSSDWKEGGSAAGLFSENFESLFGIILDNIQKSIVVSWRIIRDIANMVIVFSLLYLGIRTIIGGKGFAEKKTLGAIIVAAILVNFSLTLVNDVGFVLSNKVGIEIMSSYSVDSMSGKMLGAMSPQLLFSSMDQIPANGDWDVVVDVAVKTIYLSFTLIIAGAIFVGLILMLFYRFFVFMVLMIFSPLGIVAFAVPWLKTVGNQWWDQLKKQIIFFPAFALCMYIVFLIIGQLNAVGEFDTENILASMGVFYFNFILIMGFLVMLLILPVKIGGIGTDVINKAGSWGVGVGSRALRFGVGRGGSRLLAGKEGSKKREDLQKRAVNGGLVDRFVAKQRLRRGEGLKERTFDLRNTKVAQSMGVEKYVGKGIKGWNEEVKDKKKALEDKIEKDAKLFGVDKPESLMNDEEKREYQNKLNRAKGNRDSKAKELRDKQEELADVIKNDPTNDAKINMISGQVTALEKTLKTEEEKVGKMMSNGDGMLKLINSHRGVISRISRTKSAAITELTKDIEKEWKEKGKAKLPKTKKPTTPTTPTPPASGGRITVASGSSSTPPPLSTTSGGASLSPSLSGSSSSSTSSSSTS